MTSVIRRAGRRAGFIMSIAVGAGLMLGVAGCDPDGWGGLRSDNNRSDEPPNPIVDTWPPRAVWVVREAYDSPDEIAALMQAIQDAGLNTVLFQVRGNGTAWYRSKIEPFAYEYEGGDSGFDPLEVACREAHRRGLSLHAWVNVMPAWQGPGPPEDPKQLYNAHGDWFWYDQEGRREPIPSDFYVSLNPCLPKVRDYLVSVFEEIVSRYPVDGLHMDYIRFPVDKKPEDIDYPHDEKTLALYKRATGKGPTDDAEAWSQWRRDQVTRLVGDVRRMVKRVRPRALLSAACTWNLDRALNSYLQDGVGWLRGDLIDLVFLMNYTADVGAFKSQQEAWQREAGKRPVVPGLGIYKHDDPQTSIDQLALTERWGYGFALFSDRVLFNDESRSRLDALRPHLLEMRGRARATVRAGGRRPPAHPYGIVP